MPKDEQKKVAAENADVKGAIGRLISAGIANLGIQKSEFFDKFAPKKTEEQSKEEFEKLYSSYVGAWNKTLSGERNIDLERAEILSQYIPCGSEFLTPQEWHSLAAYPVKVPKRFYKSHSFDYKSGERPTLEANPYDKFDSTQDIKIAKKSSPKHGEEEPVAETENKDDNLDPNFKSAVLPSELDSVTVTEIRLSNGRGFVLSKPIPLAFANAAADAIDGYNPIATDQPKPPEKG